MDLMVVFKILVHGKIGKDMRIHFERCTEDKPSQGAPGLRSPVLGWGRERSADQSAALLLPLNNMFQSGPWHLVALQESSEFLDAYAIKEQFHISH